MDITQLFEHPLPNLTADADKIAVETAGGYEGTFTVKNTGGGELTGRILSNSSAVTFTPDTFAAKKTAVFYHIDTSALAPGDVIRTSAVILSNGGEKIIPIIIKALPFCIETKEDVKIASLKDFARYAKKYPEAALSLFSSNDFKTLLKETMHPHIKAYEDLLRDPVRQRALDNFLVINKIKKQAVVTPDEKTVTVTVNPYKNEAAAGSIIYNRSTWGYLDIPLTKQKGVKWLTLSKDRLTGDDFDEENEAMADFIVTPQDLTQADCEIIKAGEDCAVYIYAKRCPPLTANLQKECFTQNEKGFIEVTNNTDRDVLMEVTATDACLRFEGAKYAVVGQTARIPFEVKLTGFLTLKRRPSFKVSINLSVTEYAYKKRLDLQVGV